MDSISKIVASEADPPTADADLVSFPSFPCISRNTLHTPFRFSTFNSSLRSHLILISPTFRSLDASIAFNLIRSPDGSRNGKRFFPSVYAQDCEKWSYIGIVIVFLFLIRWTASTISVKVAQFKSSMLCSAKLGTPVRDEFGDRVLSELGCMIDVVSACA